MLKKWFLCCMISSQRPINSASSLWLFQRGSLLNLLTPGFTNRPRDFQLRVEYLYLWQYSNGERFCPIKSLPSCLACMARIVRSLDVSLEMHLYPILHATWTGSPKAILGRSGDVSFTLCVGKTLCITHRYREHALTLCAPIVLSDGDFVAELFYEWFCPERARS
jgi:hypothetical protein